MHSSAPTIGFDRRTFALAGGGLALALAASPSLVLANGVAATARPASEYQQFMIAGGDNRPSLDFNNGVLTEVLISLHAHIEDRSYDIPRSAMASPIAQLETAGLVHQLSNGLRVPTCLVASLRDQNQHLGADPAVVAAGASAIVSKLEDIRRIHASLPGFAGVTFDAASLMLLSDAALDNWQIERVERDFIRAPRPLRAGGRYYLAFLEWSTGAIADALGIYGNHSAGPISVYGNRRYRGAPTIATATPGLFGLPAGTSEAARNKILADDLVRRRRDHRAPIAVRHETGLRSLGIIADNGQVVVPILSDEDGRGLSQIAAIVAPGILRVLEEHRPALTNQYAVSPWAKEKVSFEEFAIWWYHVFYTAVTNRLIAEGAIKLPALRLANYIDLTT